MSIHDWTRVKPGTFHDFHCTWLPELKNRLNNGVLPPTHYAMVEQRAGRDIADILALASEPVEPEDVGVAVAMARPQVRITAVLDADFYALRTRRTVIRHSSDDRIVAVIEILSPGNKSSSPALKSFVNKAVDMLRQGIHLLLVDVFPTSLRDPDGIHGAIWSELGDASYEAPADKPLTLVGYCAGPPLTAYVEPAAVGDELAAMPLFLGHEDYVLTPLKASYDSAFQGVPRKWRDVLESEF